MIQTEGVLDLHRSLRAISLDKGQALQVAQTDKALPPKHQPVVRQMGRPQVTALPMAAKAVRRLEMVTSEGQTAVAKGAARLQTPARCTPTTLSRDAPARRLHSAAAPASHKGSAA